MKCAILSVLQKDAPTLSQQPLFKSGSGIKGDS